MACGPAARHARRCRPAKDDGAGNAVPRQAVADGERHRLDADRRRTSREGWDSELRGLSARGRAARAADGEAPELAADTVREQRRPRAVREALRDGYEQ